MSSDVKHYPDTGYEINNDIFSSQQDIPKVV